MGIDGIILCDCFETGRAAPPPFPVVWNEWSPEAAPGFESRSDELIAWAKAACDHEFFRMIEHKVRSGELLEAMAEHGGEKAFPAIYAALPQYNGDDPLVPHDATRCLAELDLLNTLLAPGTMAAVVDVERGTVLFGATERTLVGAPRERLTFTHLDPEAVVRVTDVEGAVYFASSEFTQERFGDAWTFRDVETGETVVHYSPIAWPWPDEAPADGAPRRLRAEVRPRDITYCMKGVGRLRELFATSVRTGRPIYWE